MNQSDVFICVVKTPRSRKGSHILAATTMVCLGSELSNGLVWPCCYGLDQHDLSVQKNKNSDIQLVCVPFFSNRCVTQNYKAA